MSEGCPYGLHCYHGTSVNVCNFSRLTSILLDARVELVSQLFYRSWPLYISYFLQVGLEITDLYAKRFWIRSQRLKGCFLDFMEK